MADVRVPLALVAAYDTLRLSIYKTKGRPDQPIHIEHLGRSTLLRFDEVGYFNTVYGLTADVAGQMANVQTRFRDSPHGFRLQSLDFDGPEGGPSVPGQWTVEATYAWLSGRVSCASATPPSPLTIRAPRSDEAVVFFETYLRAFDAPRARMRAAVDNMRHLFAEPSLHFLLALDGAQPVGVGMLFHVGRHALFCAGAMLPTHRRAGGHEALLAARFEVARSLGCDVVHSWAFADGQSHRNLTRAGLQTMARSRAWRWISDRRP